MNPYDILGVKPTATKEEIKERYRELTRRWHPDRPGGSESRMKEINAAYKEIEDAGVEPTSRHKPFWKRGDNGFGGGGDPFGFADRVTWEDLIRKATRNSDEFVWWDPMTGEFTKKNRARKPCPHCKGSGFIDA